MASYSVAAGETGAYEKTLAASTVDTVTFTEDLRRVEVINEGATGIYFTVNGAAPTVGAATTVYAPPTSVRIVQSGESGGTVVKLISSGTPKYSVAKAV